MTDIDVEPARWAPRFRHLRLDRDIPSGPAVATVEEVRHGGWAAGLQPRRKFLSYIPVDGDDDPAYAVADFWTPPHPMSLPPEVCDRLRSIAARTPRDPDRPNGAYHSVQLDTEGWTRVIDRFRLANAAWWRLDLDRWTLHAKHYLPGARQSVHEDLHPAAARRKFAGTIQLSDPEEYAGGDLVIYATDAATCMPRARGSLSAWPGGTSHEVEEVTAASAGA